MDLLRSFAFGQYVPVDSRVHRLDPRTKILATFILVIAIVAVPPTVSRAREIFLSLGILTLFLASAVVAGRIAPGYILRSLGPVWWLVGFALVFQLLLGEGGGHPVFHLGPIVITRENLILSVFYSYRIALLVVATSLMTFTTSPMELTDGLERLLGPFRRVGVPAHELALMMTIALRFIPTLLEETEKIMKAQMARGAEFSQGSVVRRVRALTPLLVPLFVGAFRRADALALAMEARCYRGGEGRTRMKELKIRPRDYVAMAAVVLTAVIALAPAFVRTL
jgi:energy-coupling factor transport system permease protein